MDIFSEVRTIGRVNKFATNFSYADRVIVPQIRHESGGAVRMLARHLDRLADVLDPDGKQAR